GQADPTARAAGLAAVLGGSGPTAASAPTADACDRQHRDSVLGDRRTEHPTRRRLLDRLPDRTHDVGVIGCLAHAASPLSLLTLAPAGATLSPIVMSPFASSTVDDGGRPAMVEPRRLQRPRRCR